MAKSDGFCATVYYGCWRTCRIRSAGAWIRVFPTEGDWVAALGSNQSFYVGTLRKTGDGLEDWELVDKRPVVELSGLMDHGIKRCPDGSYLHAASGMPPERLLARLVLLRIIYILWRYDEDFNVLAYAEFRDGIGTHAHNDPTVICAPNARECFFRFRGISLRPISLVWTLISGQRSCFS